ncbi:DUF3168 domain-containing protein [Methylocella silvestris]|uniref:DUF3168 domain-containing protein n=1 Tax=Methylocella silvestris TaxID=199596 RepID=A0A2J7TJR3_METSI|nr:DUF3168 domain-containing protein [Methylocella silvestris]PNG27005.1 hypothetical protein CR492_04695 [Methylocella silvestris]
MSSAIGEFVIALRAALKADAGVAAIVGAKVFDVVPGDKRGMPDDALAPWIYIGPVSAPRSEDECLRAWAPRVRIYCATTDFDRQSVWALADAVDAALDQKTLTLANGFTMASALRAVESGDVIDPLSPRLAYCDFTCTIYRNTPFQ